MSQEIPGFSPTLDDLVKIYQTKHGFIDPATMGAGGGGGMPPGGAPPGGDPMAAAGGAPPPTDPAAAGGGGGGPDPMLQAIMDKLNTLGSGGGAGGAGAGAGAMKPLKVDEPAVLVQILKLLARIADALKIPIPASEMVANQADVQQLAMANQAGSPMPGADPTAQAGGGGGGQSAIPPIEPLQAAAPGMGGKQSSIDDGVAFGPRVDRMQRSLHSLRSEASALAALLHEGNRAA